MVLFLSRNVLCKWQHYWQLPKCQNHHKVHKIDHTFVTTYRNSQAITELSEHFKWSSVKWGKKWAQIPQPRHSFTTYKKLSGNNTVSGPQTGHQTLKKNDVNLKKWTEMLFLNPPSFDITTHNTLRDFRIPPKSRWDMPSSGILLSIWCIWISLPFKLGPTGCPETSGKNYHHTLCNNSEERRSRTKHLSVVPATGQA